MSLPRILQLVFILYCLEVGVFLALFPWSPAWEYRLLAVLPYGWQHVLTSPFVRGAVTGFGAIHILWGFHDLRAYLARTKTPVADSPADPPETADVEQTSTSRA